MDIIDIYNGIINAEHEAAQLMLHANTILAQCKTGHRDVVTQYDRQIQNMLVEKFRRMIPDARFYCEENDMQGDLQAGHVFIIDPIDGTMNFLKGMNHSCISVAYASGGEVLCSAVYNPYVDEMFSAIKGKGAMLNGRPIHVDESPLCQTVVCCGTSPYRPELADRCFEIMRTLFINSLDVRRQASAELDLCSVAAGRAGLYFEMSLSTWDYAAGSLIVTEAGGYCRGFDGEPTVLRDGKSGIIAAGKQAMEDYFRLFGKE